MQCQAVSFDLPSASWQPAALPALDSARTLVLGFGAPELADDPRAFEELARAYPRSLVVGCSSAGEIHGTTLRDHSLAVSVTRFDKTDLQLASLEVQSAASSFPAGAHLAKKLAARPGLRAVLILSEGLNVNGSELVRGLSSVLPESVVVTGGLSADGPNFRRTWVAVGGKLKSNLIAAVGFYGEHVIVGHGSKGGWDKFGPERLVTRAEGNVLFELDGRPALALYKEYLGDKAKDLPASGLLFPLAIRASATDDKLVVRTLLSVDHERQSLTFAGDIPKGHLAQLMKADFDRLIDGAGVAGAMTLDTGKAPQDADSLVVAISCVGRRLVLGARTEEEIEAVSDAVRSDRAHITGFYSYGEISPFASGHCDLHNQTMTLTVFSESPTPLARVAGATAAAPVAKQAATPAVEDTNTDIAAPPRLRPTISASGSASGLTVTQLAYDQRAHAWSAGLPALDSARTLVLGFGAPELVDDPRAFEELARAYPRSLVVGCSSAGEIHGTTLRDHSLAVSVTRFDKTDLQLASLEVQSAANSFPAGAHLAKKLAAKPGLRAVLILSEGLNVNGSELVRGLSSVLPESVVVTGGLSADGPNFRRTWVAIGGKLKSNLIAAVGFYGEHVIIGHGSKGGWDKFGPERLVTRAEGNVLFELDGRPALALYKEYLGDKAKDLPASGLLFPLAIRTSATDDKLVVRTLLSVDHERQSLTFAGDIPKGHLAQLMKADFDRLIDGAGVAGAMTLDTGKAPPNTDSLVVAISCVGRRLVLGARTEEEIEAVSDAVRSDRAHITGFYSYGEISPFASGHCDLHNQTMTLTVFSESPTPLARAAGAGAAATPVAKQALALGKLPAPPRPGRSAGTPPPPMASAAPATTSRPSAQLPVATPALPAGYTVRAALYDATTHTWSGTLPALDSARTLVLGFGAPELVDDPRPFEELARAYPRSLVVGCSSAGEIHGTTLRDHSLAVSVARFDKTELQLASLEVQSAADSQRAGAHLAKKLSAKPGLRAVLILSEGLNVNGSELVRGLSSVLPESVVVTGGLSADGPNFRRTWVAIGGRLMSNVIAAVGFYGDHVIVGHGSKGGWDKFGPERLVTRAESNVLFELDGRPALALYKEYLGDKAKDLPASGLLFPLAIRASATDDKPVVRTLLSVDHERQSLTFAGDIPKGHLAQLMKADFDRLIDGAGVAGTMTLDTGKPPADTDSLVVAISCVGRRLVLGARTEEEIEAVSDAVRSDRAHITGFYSYGEISPFASGHCDLHNQTMTLTVFSESPTPLVRAARPTPATAPAARPAVPGGWERPVASEVSAQMATAAAPRPAIAFPTIKTTSAEVTSPVAPLGSQPIPILPPRSLASQQMPIALPPPGAAPEGPVVRVPRPLGADAVVDVSTVGELQLVRIRGRITEAFKGEQLGRTLGTRVAFDLAEVDRVTSFGVREWLAMLSAATRMTEATFLRCSEAIVNQLTMIRKFDGGARIASFFAPYLCGGCGTTLECLRDCERDAAELASHAPAPIRCPRCDGEARFDDDARSYFAFAAAHIGVALAPEVRALADAMALQVTAQPADDIEKLVADEGTRVRVLGKLTAQLRWRKIFDGIEGAMILDLSVTPASDAAGVANLEQALRALPAEVGPIHVEHAPQLLVERILQAGTERLHITSAAVAGYCRSCAVNRPAAVQVDRCAADLAAGREHPVLCKRCNGTLELVYDAALLRLLEHAQRRAALAAAPAMAEPMPPLPTQAFPVVAQAAAMPPPPRRGLSWGVALLLVALAGAVGALLMLLRAERAPSASTSTAGTAAAAPAVGAAQAATATPAPAAPAGWHASADLPPAWTERALTIEGDAMFLVGRASVAGGADAPLEAGLEAARQAATIHLLRQLQTELEGSPVSAFVAARVRDPLHEATAAAQAAMVARFEAQHGKELALTRTEVATRQRDGGAELYARYRVDRAQYTAVLASYRAVTRFRGLELAPFFPTLELALRSRGQLVVVAVERRSGAALAGVREGDVVLAVNAVPVTTVDSFRTTSAAAWASVEPRGHLTLELESAGAIRAVPLVKPAPLQP